MKITIKNVKYSAFASQETPCFEATVYVDGKAAFKVSNQGHGGGDLYYPLNNTQEHYDVNDRVAEIDAELGKEIKKFDGFELKNDLELVIGDLMNQWHVDKAIKKTLKKLAYVNSEGAIYTMPAKYKPTAQNIEGVQQTAWWKSEYKILNGLPIEEIRQYF